MRSFLDAKAMAKTLRQELQNRKIELGHSECLEVVARQAISRAPKHLIGHLAPGSMLLADKGYDANALRAAVAER
jgi:hypothetical protein